MTQKLEDHSLEEEESLSQKVRRKRLIICEISQLIRPATVESAILNFLVTQREIKR